MFASTVSPSIGLGDAGLMGFIDGIGPMRAAIEQMYAEMPIEVVVRDGGIAVRHAVHCGSFIMVAYHQDNRP